MCYRWCEKRWTAVVPEIPYDIKCDNRDAGLRALCGPEPQRKRRSSRVLYRNYVIIIP